jgi:lysozyme
MVDLARAIAIIKKYEGYSEKAYPDPDTGGAPYTFGYGTQYYPDGIPVKQGHCCTERKATEYLFHEVELIQDELSKLNLGLDPSMENSLVSFVHSIGWEPFLYSTIIDAIEAEDWGLAAEEITHWIFSSHHRVIGGLIDRRREESHLFLTEVKNTFAVPGGILIDAFRNYVATPQQLLAIQMLEDSSNPYVLAEFTNLFNCTELELEHDYRENDSTFTSWD